MPQNTRIAVGSTYTELTDANVTAISFQSQGSAVLEVVAVASGTPAESVEGVLYRALEGEDNLTIADRWLGGQIGPHYCLFIKPSSGIT